MMGETLEESPFDALALRFRKRDERLAHHGRAIRTVRGVIGTFRRGGSFEREQLLVRRLIQALPATQRAQAVDGLVPENDDGPGEGLAFDGIVIRGLVP